MTASVGVVAVNVGTPRVLARTAHGTVWSGIAKTPVADGTVLWLSRINLAGDGQADLDVHGGVDKAVYAYPSEHLPRWRDDLGDELGPAPFGENLSTVGVTEADVCVGDRWQWGDATLEVCQPRWPCFKLALHRGRADIQQLMRGTGRCGWYLRVLEPGEVVVGGEIAVVHRDPAGLTMADAYLAMLDRTLEHLDLVRALAAHHRLADEWRRPLERRLAR
jgi:MOSC domain-containing protein YiiM